MADDNESMPIYSPFSSNGGFEPSLLFAQSANPPLLSTGSPPRFTGTGNFLNGAGGDMGIILQQLMPIVISQLAGKGSVPFQVFPEQNVWDQIQAREFFQANQQAMQLAAQSDVRSVAQTIDGIKQAMFGPLTDQDRQNSFMFAQNIPQLTPMLSQIMGADMLDAMHGSRGSSAIFANQLHAALRTSRDAVTGQIGLTGESAAGVSQGVFEELFGEDYDPATLRGLSAGQAGMLARELQQRGILGVPTGAMTLEERRQAIPDQLRDETVRRIVRNLPEIRELGDSATPQQLAVAEAGVRDTYSKLKDPNLAVTDADIKDEAAMPGAKDLLRSGDASRISGRLKEMAGAVRAMRDIFGDMGNPNAPMREIVDGLNKLTQGGLTSMSAAELESTVRKTQSIAQQTGVSVDSIITLTDTTAAIADKLGINRKQAVDAAQQSTLFAAAAANTLHLDSGIQGQPTVERLAAADARLRMAAANSTAANQMGAALRLQDLGVTPQPGSELDKYITAIQEGDITYDFRKTDAQFIDMMKAAGVDEGNVRNILFDRDSNQSRGRANAVTGLVRRGIMTQDAVANEYGPAISRALQFSSMATAGQSLINAGRTDASGLQLMYRGVGEDVMRGILEMSPETFNDNEQRLEEIQKIIRASLSQKLGSDRAAEDFMRQAGGGKLMAAGVYSAMHITGRDDQNAGSAAGAYALYSDHAQAEAARGNRQATVDAMMRSAYAGVGTSTPIQRMVDILQTAGPDGLDTSDLAKLGGAVSKAELVAADPTGALMQSLGLWQQSRELDPDNPDDFAQLEFNVNALRAMSVGGEEAEKFLKKYQSDTRLQNNTDLIDIIEKASKPGYRRMESVLERLPQLGLSVSPEQLKSAVRQDMTTTEYLETSTSYARKLEADKYAKLHMGNAAFAKLNELVTANKELQDVSAAEGRNIDELLQQRPDLQRIADRSKQLWQDITTEYDKQGAAPPITNNRRELERNTQADLIARAAPDLSTSITDSVADRIQNRSRDEIAVKPENRQQSSEKLAVTITGTLEEVGTERQFSIRGTGDAAAASLLTMMGSA